MSRRWLGALVVALTAVFLTAGADAAHASACDYVGGFGGDWHQAGNWNCVPADPDGIPDGNDAVQLSGADNVLITGADEAAASLAIDTGATLQFANGRTLAVSGATNLAQANLSGTGTLASSGAWTKSGTGTLSVAGTTMQLAAGSTWMDGTICLNTGSSWKLQAALDVQAAADNVQLCSGSVGSLLVTATGIVRRRRRQPDDQRQLRQRRACRPRRRDPELGRLRGRHERRALRDRAPARSSRRARTCRWARPA